MSRTSVRVEQYMSDPPPQLSPDTELPDAARRMGEIGKGALLVGAEPLSIVTGTDMVAAIADEHDTRQLTVEEVASEVTTSVTPDQHIKQAAAEMLQSEISYLVVRREGEVVGLVSKTDLTAQQSQDSVA